MDFSYENERLVLTINCLQELDDIVKETEKRPKKVIVKNGARLTMTKIQQYFRSAMMSEVEEIEIVGGQRLCSVDGIVYTVASKIVMFCPKGRRGVVNVADGTLLVNPPRLIRFREYRRGFQTPHGRKSMPATLGRSGYLTTDTAQTQ